MPKIDQKIGVSDDEGLDAKIRETLKRVMAASRKSRLEIAEDMTALLRAQSAKHCPVTHHMLNDFTGRSDEKRGARFPAELVPAFCEATGNDDLLRLLFTPEIRALVSLGECDFIEQSKRRAKANIFSGLLEMPKYRGAGNVR